MRSTLTILLLTCFMFSNALKLKKTSKLGGEKRTEILYPSDELVADGDREDFLLSINKIYKLVNQKDGNLVLYNIWKKEALWATKTNLNGYQLPTRFILQEDGNLVLQDSNKKVMWSSGSECKGCQLMIDNGSLTLKKSHILHAKVAWSTGTEGGKKNL